MVASDADKVIGSNVALWRGEMSQQALAEAMREKGHKWSQSTVWAVEKGDRPLRLSESESLQQILGNGSVLPLTTPPSWSYAWREFIELHGRRDELVYGLVQYLEDRLTLAQATIQQEGRDLPPPEMAARLADWLDNKGAPEAILRDAVIRFGMKMGERDRLYPIKLPGHSAEVDEAYVERASKADVELAESIKALRKLAEDAE